MTRRLACLAVLLAPAAASADEFARVGPTRQGHLDFVMVGASLVDNQGLGNGVNCLKPSASAQITTADLPARQRLVSATLYIGGSLIGDDGPDYDNPPREIFSTPGLRADDQLQFFQVEDAARLAADRTADFTPPGGGVQSLTSNSVAVSVYYSPGGNEQGNVGFFVTSFDVTAALTGGPLAGTYTVGGVEADVCRGPEAVCVNPPNPPTCSSLGATHTNGAASWALVLLVEDLELPLRSVSQFAGLQSIAGYGDTSVPPLNLEMLLNNPVSSPAAGSLAFYALEGDLLFPATIRPFSPCGAEEFVEVDGDLDPSQNGLCLVDDDNPLDNIFNSTINVQPAAAPPGPCNQPAPHQCCQGDGLCGVTGVDIDRFDISAALTPGATSVQVRMGSGTDRIALASVMLAVDVFEPVLVEDTQIRVLDQVDGMVRVGGPITYSIAVSNTGNVAATSVSVRFSPPAFTAGIQVIGMPADAIATVSQSGGDHATGEALVSGFRVPAGEIAEVRVRTTSVCAAVLRTLQAAADVSSAEVPGFSVAAPEVVARGPGQALCDETELDGPLRHPTPPRSLAGGGGCNQAGTPSVLGPLGLALFAVWRRRRKTSANSWVPGFPRRFFLDSLRLLIVCLLAGACAERHQPTEPPPVPSRAITDLAALPGEPCGTPLRVFVTRADSSRFCIDRFEASLDGGALGDAMQGASDTDLSLNNTTRAKATLTLAALPAASLSWYQARAACQNAGKELCSRVDWQTACRGPADLFYPYGDTMDEHACQGFFNYPPDKPTLTGSLSTCGSAFGVYDLSGNLEEWVFDAVPRIPGTTLLNDRAVRGGSFKSNSLALACVGDAFHEPPDSADIDRGFRCCSPGPVP